LRILRWFLYACLFGFGVVAGTYLLIRVSFTGTGAVVPPVAGLTQEQAEFQARHAHLLFAVQAERYDLKAVKGTVISQVPAAGMPARRGNTLSVVVSKGVEKIDTPNLVGRRIDEAQIGLRQAGVRLASTAFIRTALPAQTVIAQDPPGGTVVPRDSEVSILVSAGPPVYTFVTPDLVGTASQDAQRGLSAYGIQAMALRTQKDSGSTPGTILAQAPLPGLPIGRSDMIQLTVSEP
jgi:eukaryotic-like serine/threonine-protein kinase